MERKHWRIQGGARQAPPLTFISMQFWAKILPNNKFLPQTEGLAPHQSGKILDPILVSELFSSVQNGQREMNNPCRHVVSNNTRRKRINLASVH